MPSYLHPVNLAPAPRISSPFGWRTHPLSGGRKMHNGIDFPVPVGTPLVAVAKGSVLRCYHGDTQHGDYGNAVILLLQDGAAALYAHLSRVDLVEGSAIAAGDAVGLSGDTGRVTGPHLHFEIISAPHVGRIARNGRSIGLPGTWLDAGGNSVTARVDPAGMIVGL